MICHWASEWRREGLYRQKTYSQQQSSYSTKLIMENTYVLKMNEQLFIFLIFMFMLFVIYYITCKDILIQMILIGVLLLLFTIGASQGCNPLYPRVHYGQEFLLDSQQDSFAFKNFDVNDANYANNVTMIIKFNTEVSCKKSYVSIVKKLQINKFGCTESLLKIGQGSQFIQTCKVEVPNDAFQYRLVGTPTLDEQTIHLNIQPNEATYSIELPTQQKVNFIVTSNWGSIKTKPYKPIQSSLQLIIKGASKSYPTIHALVINGDFTGAFDSLQNYKQFMAQLSSVSPYCPLIVTPGSKQSLSTSNYQILSKTFELYQVKYPQRVQIYNIGPASLISYDPWLENFNKATPKQSQMFLKHIQKALDSLKTGNKAKIVTNSYALICSQDNQKCRNAFKYYPQIVSLLDTSSIIDLYIGGHQTQYQRIAPYKNGNFHSELKEPYSRGQMVSVVQAVAGNDQYIVDQPYQRREYSVAGSYNRTGFGLVSVQGDNSSTKITYVHYCVQPTLSVFDNFTIQGNKGQIGLANLKSQ